MFSGVPIGGRAGEWVAIRQNSRHTLPNKTPSGYVVKDGVPMGGFTGMEPWN